MKLKIRNSEVISFRVSGDAYYKGMIRADNRKISVGDFAKIAYLRYIGIKDISSEFGDKEVETNDNKRTE